MSDHISDIFLLIEASPSLCSSSSTISVLHFAAWLVRVLIDSCNFSIFIILEPSKPLLFLKKHFYGTFGDIFLDVAFFKDMTMGIVLLIFIFLIPHYRSPMQAVYRNDQRLLASTVPV